MRVGEVGAQIADRFVLEACVGRGSFGEVWSAFDRKQAGQRVAVKLLHREMSAKARILRRFEQEARILQRLEHPGIARSIAWAVTPEGAYLAMEFVRGESLADRLSARSSAKQPFQSEPLIALLQGVAEAVDYAHQAQVVHRDLKPRNVMIDRSLAPPRLKVLDFGIAKILIGPELDPSTMGAMVGSVLYMAPEQVRARPVSFRTDVFALGSIAYEMLTLRRAWALGRDQKPLACHEKLPEIAENAPEAVLKRISEGKRPKVRPFRPDLSPRVDMVLDGALAIESDRRYPGPLAFVDALKRALSAS